MCWLAEWNRMEKKVILTVLVLALAIHRLLKMIIAILIHAKLHETITILHKYYLDKYRDTLKGRLVNSAVFKALFSLLSLTTTN